MHRIWIWLLVIFFIPGTLLAEKTIEKRISELKKRLVQVSGKEKVDILNKLARNSFRHATRESIDYGKQALNLSQKLRYHEGEAEALINLGLGYSHSGRDYQKSLGFYQQALRWFEKQGNQKQMGNTLLKIGIVHQNISRYHQALEYYRKALKIYENLSYTNGISSALSNIGIIYDDLALYDQVLEYFIKSSKIETSGKKQKSGASLTNIGTIYWRIKNYDKALEYYLESLKMKQEIGSKRGIAYTLINIGAVHNSMHHYHQALQYFFRALDMMKKVEDQIGLARSLGNIGDIYLKLKKFNEARPYLEQCLKIAEKIKAQDLLREHYQNISQLYEATGNPQKALQYFKLFQQVDRKIFNETSSHQIAQLQIQYETEKKEHQINVLEQEKRMQILENRVKTIISLKTI